MASGGVSSGAQPRQRQRAYKPPPELPVPDIDDDAAERKRVLNVLAQRRYREKKRHSRKRGNETKQKDSSGAEAATGHQELEDADIEIINQPDLQEQCTISVTGLDSLGMDSWEALDDPALTAAIANSPTPSDIFSTSDPASDMPFFSSGPPITASLSEIMLSSPPASSRSSSSSSSSSWSFPDGVLLPVHELTLLRALLRIASRIGCTTTTLWSPTGISPFVNAPMPSHLPQPWRPTLQQSTIPHHPLLDLLPWPSARDRLIGIMTLPEGVPRPPAAEGPMALANLAYDIEDGAEGVRIYGEDPCDPLCWEVGQVFFERWWFLFDRQIVETSNRWRSLRGAPPLTMKPDEGSTVLM